VTMDITKVKPHGCFVLIKVDPPEEKTKSGLFRPQGNLEDRVGRATGTVVAVGPGIINKGKAAVKYGKYRPLDVKVGDKVMFRGFLQVLSRPNELTPDDNYCMLSAIDIDGVIEENENG
jgi:co-chaperonin GroES (HSP10)